MRRLRIHADRGRREKEVLRRLIDGQGTGQMAREMNISTSTLRLM